MSAQSFHFPAPRVPPNAGHAFGGIWRLTARRLVTPRHWLTVAGLLAVLVLFALPAASNQAAAARTFLPWMADFYVSFLVPLLAFISAAGVVRDDLGAGSVDYIFTRPVRRPTFVAFRYLAHVGCAQLNFLFGLATLIGFAVYREVPGVWAAAGSLLLAQVAVIAAFSAFGFLCAMLTSRYVIVGLLYGAIIEVGIGNVPTQLNRISMIRHAREIMRPVLGETGSEMSGPLAADPLGTPAAVALLLVFSALMLGAAALVLRFKELAGAADRDV